MNKQELNAIGIRKIIITSISAIDKLAYQIYPNYAEFFKAVNYGAFMRGRKEVNFIVPIFIKVLGSKSKSKLD